MREVAPRLGDRLVFLGDYTDRGPDSRGVIEYLIRLRERFSDAIFLQGNHERLMLDALTEAGIERGVPYLSSTSLSWGRETAWACIPVIESNHMLWMLNHGDVTLNSFGYALPEIPPNQIASLASTALWYRHEDILFVHGSLGTEQLKEDQDPYRILWDRDGLWMYDGKWNLRVVHGHTLVSNPFISRKELSLDTGAGYGGPLTACDVFSEKIWQA